MNQQGMAGNSLAYQQQLANQGLGMQAQNQGFNQALAEAMLPYQQATALKGLASPSFASYATVAPTNYTSAMQNAYQGNLANANAENANRNSMISGLFNLGGAAIMSDIRTKENIKQIGVLQNGLNVYQFEYKDIFKDRAGHGVRVGVMAQEVENIIPEAIVVSKDGYKMVNYSMLGI